MADNKEKVVEQPQVQFQELLDNILYDEPTDVTFRGKWHTMRWLTYGTVRKFSHVVIKEKNESKRNVKICAALLLNNKWKLWFYYPFYWRWLYYICDLDDVEVLRVVDVAKKKIPSTASQMLTILATGMTDLMMTMTREEAKAIQAAQAGGPPTH